MAEPTFECVLPFDTDEPEFARGFEAGRVWQMLDEYDGPVTAVVVHASNAEMLIRMAESQNRSARSRDLDETWVEIDFTERRDGA